MGRHTAQRSRPKAVVAIVPALALAGIGGAYAVSHNHGDDSKPTSAETSTTSTATAGGLAGCSTTTPLAITTTNDMAGPLRQITSRLEADRHTCVKFSVNGENSSITASGLMSGANDSTQVWIPDSSLWPARVSAANPAASVTTGPPIAQSPIVFAVPRGVSARAKHGSMSWPQLIAQKVAPIKVASPERSTNSLLALLGVNKAVQPSAGDTRALQTLLIGLSRQTTDEAELRRQVSSSSGDTVTFPISEQQIYQINQAHPGSEVRVITPATNDPQLDYPIVTVGGAKAPKDTAVQALHDALTSAAGVDTLRKAGFRVGDSAGPGVEGVPDKVNDPMPTPQPAEADLALRAWVTMSRQTRMLTVLDTSESMKHPAGPGMDRMHLAIAGCLGPLAKFPPSAQIGLWSFDMKMPGESQDWIERVPIRALNEPVAGGTQRDALARAAASLNWRKANGTALRDTIWGAYQAVQRAYQPDYTNSVILLTDGKDDDPDSMPEAQLIANLQKASRDSSRPVRLIMVAISQDADYAALQRIAKALPPGQGQAYDARNPANFPTIVQAALASRDLTTAQ